jgi:serine/threonine-protein kinase RsbW
MSGTLRVEHRAELANLPLLLGFIDDACRRAGADAETAFALRLAVEEVCMNLIRHGYRGREPGPIALEFDGDREAVAVTICDRAPPFDPSQAPVPDVAAPLEERSIGGLGWHLVKSMVDRVEYRSDPQLGNRLTLVKRRAGNQGRG